MADVLLFHHAQGQTPGFLAFADALRAAGHTVHTPDLYGGEQLRDPGRGDGQRPLGRLRQRSPSRASPRPTGCPTTLVYAGSPSASWPAQRLAQTRPGARGPSCSNGACRRRVGAGRRAYRCRSTAWTADPFFADEGDVDAARAVVAAAEDGELFAYPGCGHLFADASRPPTTRRRLRSCSSACSASSRGPDPGGGSSVGPFVGRPGSSRPRPTGCRRGWAAER